MVVSALILWLLFFLIYGIYYIRCPNVVNSYSFNVIIGKLYKSHFRENVSEFRNGKGLISATLIKICKFGSWVDSTLTRTHINPNIRQSEIISEIPRDMNYSRVEWGDAHNPIMAVNEKLDEANIYLVEHDSDGMVCLFKL